MLTDKKEVLKSISGEFRGLELSAIIGQSGSGKTSMLNLLSGYTTKNSSGAIRINGKDDRRHRLIRKSSKYIMQDYTLHAFITVREAMKFAANLKLHRMNETSKDYKVRGKHEKYFYDNSA